MVCREKEKEENLLGKENVWFAEKTKKNIEGKRGEYSEKENVTICDRGEQIIRNSNDI